MTIQLPKPGQIIPARGINPRLLLLYGPPKVGKTQIINQMKDSYLLIDLDDGTEFFEGTYIRVSDLKELNEVGNEVLSSGRPYKYIVVDTVTELASWCEDYATHLYKQSIIGRTFKGQDVVGELPKGGGYHWLRKAFDVWFKFLKSLSDRVILVGHLKDASLAIKSGDIMVENKGISTVDPMDIDLTGKLKQITCSKADAIGYIYRKDVRNEETKKTESQLRVNFYSGSSVLGGARCAHLRGVDMEFDWEKIYLKENQS